MPLPLEVVDTGDRCVYFVHSEENPKRVYRVSLLEHEGRAECMCKWWQTHCWPLIRDGQPLTNPDTACKHVREARRHFLQQLLPAMAAQETDSTVTRRQR